MAMESSKLQRNIKDCAQIPLFSTHMCMLSMNFVTKMFLLITSNWKSVFVQSQGTPSPPIKKKQTVVWVPLFILQFIHDGYSTLNIPLISSEVGHLHAADK